MSDVFMRHRSRPITLALAANLGRLARAGSALGVGRAASGASAVVIGGGPSCGGFERIPAGALTMCVNTSAPRVCAEFSPHAVVVREVVALPDQFARLKRKPRAVVLDIQTAPATVEAAHALGVPVLWIVPGQTNLAWLIRLLGVVPAYGGESAVTLAVSLTERLGARRVSLIGCDLAFGAEGEAYGRGTAYDGLSVATRGEVVDFGDRAGMQARSRASGVPGPLLREHATPVLCEDGTTRPALATWCSQRTWLEQWASRHPGTAFANLSGGARIEGWPAAGTVHPGPPLDALPTEALDVSGIDREVRRQLRAARAAVDSREPWTLLDAALGWPIVEFAAQRDILETSAMGLSMRLALAERTPILRRAIDAVERAYEGGE